MAEIEIYKKSPGEFDLGQRRGRRAMRSQVIMFSLMIFLTLTSFTIVMASNAEVIGFSKYYVIPVIMLFAAVQVGLQLYYFMHMQEKGHGIASNVYVYWSIACIPNRFNICYNCLVELNEESLGRYILSPGFFPYLS